MINMQGVKNCIHKDVPRNHFAVMRENVVVCQGVKQGARAALYGVVSFCLVMKG